jgi:hypothetical protein
VYLIWHGRLPVPILFLPAHRSSNAIASQASVFRVEFPLLTAPPLSVRAALQKDSILGAGFYMLFSGEF